MLATISLIFSLWSNLNPYTQALLTTICYKIFFSASRASLFRNFRTLKWANNPLRIFFLAFCLHLYVLCKTSEMLENPLYSTDFLLVVLFFEQWKLLKNVGKLKKKCKNSKKPSSQKKILRLISPSLFCFGG